MLKLNMSQMLWREDGKSMGRITRTIFETEKKMDEGEIRSIYQTAHDFNYFERYASNKAAGKLPWSLRNVVRGFVEQCLSFMTIRFPANKRSKLVFFHFQGEVVRDVLEMDGDVRESRALLWLCLESFTRRYKTSNGKGDDIKYAANLLNNMAPCAVSSVRDSIDQIMHDKTKRLNFLFTCCSWSEKF
jgi:hypothetical protein